MAATAASDSPSSGALTEGQKVLDELLDLFGFRPEGGADADFVREIEEAIAARTAAKKAKNYAEADRIRADLLARGVVLEDTAQGTKYRIQS